MENNLITTDKTIKAEQAVLGSVFLDQDSMDKIIDLEARDFLTATHSQLFEVMRYLHRNNKPVDVITVVGEYQKFDRVGDMGGPSYIHELAESTPTAANVTFYADIVRSRAIRRRGVKTSEEIKRLSEEGELENEEYFSTMEKLIEDLRPKEKGKMITMSDSKQGYFDYLEQKEQLIKTGFSKYDLWSGGLSRQDLFISAGRPGSGKTAMMLQRCISVARQGEGIVPIFSQEMSRNQLTDRMISCLANIPYGRIRKRNFSDSDRPKIEKAYEELENLPILIQDTAAITIDEIRATCRSLIRQHGKIALIAVDYLQIMNIPQKLNETRAQAIGHVTGRAKQTARELDCIFYLLCQQTREDQRAKSKKPTLADLKESGSIEQDADVCEFLYVNDEDYHESGSDVIRQLTAKGRNTGLNESKLLFKSHFMKFEEL